LEELQVDEEKGPEEKHFLRKEKANEEEVHTNETEQMSEEEKTPEENEGELIPENATPIKVIGLTDAGNETAAMKW
jgi:hypothetical protein